MSERIILVVAAHPDDESLGCAGTIASHVERGDKVHVIFMSDGVTSRADTKVEEVRARKKAAKDACSILGVEKSPEFLGFPDNRMDTIALLDIVMTLEQVINKIKPEIIYTHHFGDLNIDHRITHQAVMTVCRPQPKSFVSEIYSFEVLSSTGWNSSRSENEFIPNVFIDIRKTWQKKIKALYCYNDELRDFPHTRSYKNIEALATYRGANVGIEYAEAFALERKVIKEIF
jgi:N-acetylglucosamine malate deacetylase 1